MEAALPLPLPLLPFPLNLELATANLAPEADRDDHRASDRRKLAQEESRRVRVVSCERCLWRRRREVGKERWLKRGRWRLNRRIYRNQKADTDGEEREEEKMKSGERDKGREIPRQGRMLSRFEFKTRDDGRTHGSKTPPPLPLPGEVVEKKKEEARGIPPVDVVVAVLRQRRRSEVRSAPSSSDGSRLDLSSSPSLARPDGRAYLFPTEEEKEEGSLLAVVSEKKMEARRGSPEAEAEPPGVVLPPPAPKSP